MTPAVLALTGTLLLAAGPVPRADVRVDVRVTRELGGTATFVEFSPDQASWVALYGTFSDGSLRTLFPSEDEEASWVPANEVRVIPVDVPAGLRLETVQAVASPRWFDPRELWIASAPATPSDRVSTGNEKGLWA